MDYVWISESPNLGKTERLVGQSRKLRKQNKFDTPLSRENFLHWDFRGRGGVGPEGGGIILSNLEPFARNGAVRCSSSSLATFPESTLSYYVWAAGERMEEE